MTSTWILAAALAVTAPLGAAYGSGSEKAQVESAFKSAGSSSEKPMWSVSEKEPLVGLAVGASAPGLTALDQDGKVWDLSQALESGPVLLIFQRGHWCPYCMAELKEVQAKVLAEAKDAGVSVFALSVDPPAKNKATREEFGLEFPLLSVDEKVLKAFKILNLEAKSKPRYAHPATYLVGKDGVIRWARADKNYKIRAAPKDLIDAFGTVSGD